MSNELTYFGKKLIEEVRDRTIRGVDLRLKGAMKDEESIKLAGLIKTMSKQDKTVISQIIPLTVDLCIHNLLCMLEDDKDINISVNGIDVIEESDGLAGELYTEDGWILNYSTERKNTF